METERTRYARFFSDKFWVAVMLVGSISICLFVYLFMGSDAPSIIDGAPRASKRVHSTHVNCVSNNATSSTFVRDDGRQITVVWENEPVALEKTCRGTLFARESFQDRMEEVLDDPFDGKVDIGTYLFDHFVPDLATEENHLSLPPTTRVIMERGTLAVNLGQLYW